MKKPIRRYIPYPSFRDHFKHLSLSKRGPLVKSPRGKLAAREELIHSSNNLVTNRIFIRVCIFYNKRCGACRKKKELLKQHTATCYYYYYTAVQQRRDLSFLFVFFVFASLFRFYFYYYINV